MQILRKSMFSRTVYTYIAKCEKFAGGKIREKTAYPASQSISRNYSTNSNVSFCKIYSNVKRFCRNKNALKGGSRNGETGFVTTHMRMVRPADIP